MAYIDNTQTKKEIEDAIRGNSVSNLAPTDVSKDVQLVLNVNPKDYRILNIVKRQASGTIYTTPANKKFFLSGFNISFSSTAAGDNTLALTGFIKGDTSTTIIGRGVVKNTALIDAGNAHLSQSFERPIEMEPNTVIAASASGTVTSGNVTIFGYTVEP